MSNLSNVIIDIFFTVAFIFMLKQQLKNVAWIDALKKYRLHDKSYVITPKLVISMVVSYFIGMGLFNYVNVHADAPRVLTRLMLCAFLLMVIFFFILLLFLLFQMGKALVYACKRLEYKYKEDYVNQNLRFYDVCWAIFGLGFVLSIIVHCVMDVIKLFA